MNPSNVVERFRAQAEARPDAVALVEGAGRRRRTVTFGDLDRAAARGAAQLAAAGLRPGDAVLLLVPVSVALYEALAAVLRAGCVAVVLDPGAGRAHVERCCALRPPDAFVGSPKAHLLRLLVPGVRRIPRRFSVGGWVPGAERWGGREGAMAIVPRGTDDPALLTFTSGTTTGQPRAAVRTHGLLAAQHEALAEALALAPGQVDLATLPVVVLATLASGVTTVLADADLRRPGRVDAARLARQIAREGVTRCTASPALFERLLAAPHGLAGLRRVDTGGAPVFPDLHARLAAAVPEAVAVYGSTEAEPIAHADPPSEADLARVAAGDGLPAGVPVPQVRVQIVAEAAGQPLGPFTPDAWAALALPAGAVGEICVAGDHVVPGYLNGDGDAEAKITVGDVRWHRTGDAGRLDAGGRLWLAGRAGGGAPRPDGRTVYPLQVEAAVRVATGLRCAFLVHDGRRTLAVQTRTVTAEARGDATRTRVANTEALIREAVPWASLERIVVVPRLPVDRRHNAKIDVPALRTLLDRSA